MFSTRQEKGGRRIEGRERRGGGERREDSLEGKEGGRGGGLGWGGQYKEQEEEMFSFLHCRTWSRPLLCGREGAC